MGDQRKWGWLDTFLFFVRTLWIYYNASWVLSVTFNETSKWFLFFWFLCIYIIPCLFYRPGYIKLFHYVTAESLLVGSMFVYMANQFHVVDMYDFLYLPFITIAYACQARPLSWIGPLASAAIFISGTGAGSLFGNENIIGLFINAALFYGFGFSLGRITTINNKRKELLESIEEKNKTLEQYSKRIEELTIMEERNRVSQDLHDTVGHIFTSVITSLDALPFVMKKNPEGAQNSIMEIANLARKGLEDVRKTIHQLSPTEAHQPLSFAFKQITDEFQKHTGTKVDFQMDGNERELNGRMKYTLTRCLQEGLTNAKRHGQATQVIVKLKYTDEALLLHIKDNGVGTKVIKSGFGLETMKDRISSMGGSFKVESKVNEGTVIDCMAPLAKEVTA